MSTASLEERVAELELHYAELLKLVQTRPVHGAWRSVVGMFADDQDIQQLHEETRRIRAEDRKAASGEGQP